MKIICDTEMLSQVSQNVQKAVMTKTTMPILEGILFTAKKGGLKLTGYDLEIGIEKTVEAEVIEEGSVIINAKTLVDILRLIPYDRVTVESDDKLQTRIYSGEIEYVMAGMDPKEYPELPTINGEQTLEIPGNKLKSMIKNTIFSVAVSDVRVVHKGIKFEVRKGELRLVAIDSHRISIRREFINYDGSDLNFVVPAKTMGEISRMIPDDEKFVNISLGRRNIMFKIDDYTVISRLLEGEFLKYESVIPKKYNTTVRVKTKDLIECIERVSVIISEKYQAPLVMNFEEGSLKLSSATAIGTSSDKIDVSIDGENVKVGIQSKYILEALRACETDEVLISIVSNVQPVCILPAEENDSFLYIILPVKMS